MNVPKGMTSEQVLEVMIKVINRIAPRYTFYGYTEEDIKQESYIICHEALDRYDQKRPLENFLSVNLSNRLKNFLRDNHFTNNDSTDRVKVMQPAQLDGEDSILDNPDYFMSYDNVENQDMVQIINTHLPAFMRMDYLRMINGVSINKNRRIEILTTVKEILEEHGYYEEG